MRAIFQSPRNELQYQENGYIKHPLLRSEEIDHLLEVYGQLSSGLENSKFYTSHTSNNTAYKRKVDAAIKEVLVPKFEELFIDYKPVFGFYLVKSFGSETLSLHLDWQFVDERKHAGFNIWCPLTETRKENGALFVIPGSHRVVNVLRGYNTPNPILYLEKPIDEKKLVTVPLLAGEALIFDLRLLHGAWPNTQPQERVAIGMVAIPEEAEILHFWAANENRDNRKIEVYRMEPEMYMHNHSGNKPSQENFVGVWDDDRREETIKSISQHYTKKNWIQKLIGSK